jgi:hypothetical protein
MKTFTSICGTFLIGFALFDFGLKYPDPKFFIYMFLINVIWIAVIEQVLFKTPVK